MTEKNRKLKENAARLIAKGKFAEAADDYRKIVKADPRDLAARQKLGEIYARMGKIKEAVQEYQSVAGSYAADGLLLKAIAICKVILSVDPSHNETQAVLADLYARRRGDVGAVEMPKAMSAAIAAPKPPGAKRSASEIRGLPESRLPTKSQVDQNRHAPIELDPEPAAVVVAPAAARRQAPDIEIDLGGQDVEVVGIEDAPHGLGAPLSTNLVEVMAAAKDPTGSFDLPVATDPGADALDVPLGSLEGPPVVVGRSLSQEDPPPPADLPPDELFLDDGGAGEVLELVETARVDVDAMPPMPLFSDLPKEAFIALTERMELRTFAPGQVVVQEGDAGTSMFVVVQGTLKVVRTGDGQAMVSLAELTDGAFFGEMALLSDAPRSATVVAVDDVMLFELSRELIDEITREFPQVAEVMKRFHKNRLLTNLLKTSPIFAPFSAAEKKVLIEKFKSRNIPEGSYVITRERPGDGLYVVLQGRCVVLDVDAQRREKVLAELKEGDVFGEMSMLWHKETCASVRASTPCVVLRMPKTAFNEVIMTHPQILETLTNLSEKRARLNDELKAANDAPLRDFLV